jgi:phosphate transport system protein
MDVVRDRLAEMASCCERAVRGAVQAFLERNRQQAYAVIIRDQRIDALEKEIDRLCLEFLVRQQPAGGLLRFAYTAIKVNAELERVGDYAQTIAHQAAKLSEVPFTVPNERFVQIADLAVAMLADSIRAFLDRDADLARRTIETEDTVDGLKTRLRTDLFGWYKANRLPFEALDPCLTITRRLERVSDQARDICLEVLYLCTGEYAKHSGTDTFRVLLVDGHDAGAGPMAEALGESLGRSQFRFSSVGLEPRPLPEFTLQFLREKGFDLARRAPKSLTAVPDLDQYHVVVALTPDANKVLPRHAHKRIRLDWHLDDPALEAGGPDQMRRAHEAAFQFLETHIRALVDAVLDEGQPPQTVNPGSPT